MSDTSSLFNGFENSLAAKSNLDTIVNMPRTSSPMLSSMASPSRGSVGEMSEVGCLECGELFSFLEGTVSFKCPSCESINCFQCQQIHGEKCPTDDPPIDDPVTSKLSQDRSRRAVKRSASFSYKESARKVSQVAQLQTAATDDESEIPQKLAKMDLPVYTTKDLLNVCRVCAYQTRFNYRFLRHSRSVNHAKMMKKFESTGLYAD